MLDRDNILDIINKYQEEMDDLQRGLKTITNDNVRNAVKDRLVNLAAKKFGLELTAREWGLMRRPSLPAPDADIIVRGTCESTEK